MRIFVLIDFVFFNWNKRLLYILCSYLWIFQSFTNQTAFIITNLPTQGDALEFLRLITDYDSEVVICMEPLCNMESVRTMLLIYLIWNIYTLKLVCILKCLFCNDFENASSKPSFSGEQMEANYKQVKNSQSLHSQITTRTNNRHQK